MTMQGWGIFIILCLIIIGAGIRLFTTPPEQSKGKLPLAFTPFAAGILFWILPHSIMAAETDGSFSRGLQTVFPLVCITTSLIFLTAARKRLERSTR